MASLENFTSNHLKYCSYCKSCHFKNTNTTEEILWIPNYIHLKYQNSRPYHVVKTLLADSRSQMDIGYSKHSKNQLRILEAMNLTLIFYKQQDATKSTGTNFYRYIYISCDHRYPDSIALYKIVFKIIFPLRSDTFCKN